MYFDEALRRRLSLKQQCPPSLGSFWGVVMSKLYTIASHYTVLATSEIDSGDVTQGRRSCLVYTKPQILAITT